MTVKASPAEIVREYGPFEGVSAIHGVTHDDHHVWAATGPMLMALDPASGQAARTLACAGDAGTAFDASTSTRSPNHASTRSTRPRAGWWPPSPRRDRATIRA